jgi:hypothetical protein
VRYFLVEAASADVARQIRRCCAQSFAEGETHTLANENQAAASVELLNSPPCADLAIAAPLLYQSTSSSRRAPARGLGHEPRSNNLR